MSSATAASRRTERQIEGGVERIAFSIAPTPPSKSTPRSDPREPPFASMQQLFEPSAVAVVGASRERGKIGAEIFHNLHGAFRGRTVPINPRAEEIEGERCYARHRGAGGFGSGRHRRSGRAGRSRGRRLRGQGSLRHRGHHGRLLGDRRRRTPPRARAGRKGPGRGNPNDRAQLHGPDQHRSPVPPRTRRSGPSILPRGASLCLPRAGRSDSRCSTTRRSSTSAYRRSSPWATRRTSPATT